jgi:hypothetical protein
MHLALKICIGTVKPETPMCATVNAQRSTDGIAVPTGLQRVLLGEDFNSVLPAPLDGDTQPQGKAANVDPAVPCWEWFRHENPEMSTPATILKSRFHPVLLEVKLQFPEVRKRILVVRVDGHPLRALNGGVEGVKADGDFALQVTADGVQRQAQPLAGFLIVEPVVVMPGAFWVGSIGLEGVSPAVDEETEVIRHHAAGCFETKHPHSLLPEGKWMAPLLFVCGETITVLCHADWKILKIALDRRSGRVYLSSTTFWYQPIKVVLQAGVQIYTNEEGEHTCHTI